MHQDTDSAPAEIIAIGDTYLHQHNADLAASCVWVPTTAPAGQQARLPSHEHVDALASIQLVQS